MFALALQHLAEAFLELLLPSLRSALRAAIRQAVSLLSAPLADLRRSDVVLPGDLGGGFLTLITPRATRALNSAVRCLRFLFTVQ